MADDKMTELPNSSVGSDGVPRIDNAFVVNETIIIEEVADTGSIVLTGKGLSVENGNLIINNPNYEEKDGNLIIYKNRK